MNENGINRETIVEAGLNLIPYVGGSLATLYSATKDKKRFERIKTFYDEVSSKIENMDGSLQDLLNSQTHDEESLINLIENINEQVEKENRNKKKQYLQSFFINSLLSSTNEKTLDQKQIFLDALSSMSLLECELLALLFNQNEIIEISRIGMHENNDPYAILGIVNRLRNFGFIEIYSGEVHLGAKDNALSERVKISGYGKDFVSFCLL